MNSSLPTGTVSNRARDVASSSSSTVADSNAALAFGWSPFAVTHYCALRTGHVGPKVPAGRGETPLGMARRERPR